ncbi:MULTISPECIES: SDR family oxidoreductase [Sphingomonadaceae]|uniref:SDR family oxidoreductase n=1 Tax=Sphingomonadaceae TaxID=41297 RepID=UPI0000DD0508|nr:MULTISPECIES: SDR family oxidoreductase [Sphingomonadaceae]QDK35692.1 SDR family NAD(P)-dependent oxidoreductase [Sphingomonas sp. IC081]QSR20503.1 NAD(P)-dependent oxidoreductase [Novosphingobium sp. KA1]BAF03319.1 putative short chain dehydrogenase [Novosphingobium sp. KA1]
MTIKGAIDLVGRTILVSGGARGLGAAFAEACGKAGARVLIADIRADLGAETATRLRADGIDIDHYEVDLADPSSIVRLAGRIAEDVGVLDGLLNNAALATGIGGKGFDEIDIETWDRVMAINVRGTWLMTRAFAPMLKASAHGGRVVNLASDTALWGAPNLLHYVSSKGAVISMTRSLARELGAAGVSVNAIAPGLVRVEATDYVPEQRKQLYVQGAAIQRPQVPEDTVGTAVFLLSDAAAFVSGQVIPVNGGFVSA